MVDKKKKLPVEVQDIIALTDAGLSIRDIYASRQENGVIKIKGGKYVGVAVFGDMHIGSWNVDYKLLFEHVDKVNETENMYAVQVGDMMSNESSLSHRGSRRIPPQEFDLAVQRKTVVAWFERIGKKMLAFCTGNHDIRSMYSENFDIGEEIVDKIKGFYLGPKGKFTIKLGKQEYRFYIGHSFGGRSIHNPNYGAKRSGFMMFRDLDAVIHGHIHEGPQISDDIVGDNKNGIMLRSGHYFKRKSFFEQGLDGYTTQPETPVIILNSETRELIPIRKLETGIKLLQLLNGE